MTEDSVHSDTAVSDEVEQSLYAKRKKIYPREVHGVFAAFRAAGVSILLGFYYIVPWLQWDNHQLVLFDLPGAAVVILLADIIILCLHVFFMKKLIDLKFLGYIRCWLLSRPAPKVLAPLRLTNQTKSSFERKDVPLNRSNVYIQSGRKFSLRYLFDFPEINKELTYKIIFLHPIWHIVKIRKKTPVKEFLI